MAEATTSLLVLADADPETSTCTDANYDIPEVPDEPYDHNVPQIPKLGNVNHFSIEVIWERALQRAKDEGGLKGPIKVVLEYKQQKPGTEWQLIYKGMAKKTTVTDLVPKTEYQFRYKLEHGKEGWSTDWSKTCTFQTTKEPLYAENLHMAIKRMDLVKLEEVLKSGDVNANVQNEEGFTALQAAAKKPFVEAIDKLIEFGADVDFQNHAGKTALMTACTANQLDCVQALRNHNADYNIFDNGGCTAIHWAVDAKSVKLIEWLGSHGADFNVKDKGHGGWTPLIRCANMHGDRDVGLALMMNGADINGTDNNGSTAFHHAIMRKYFDLCQLLVQRRADPLVVNKEGNTPWQIAQSGDDKRRIMQLMEPYVEELKKKKKSSSINVSNNSAVTKTTTTATARSPAKRTMKPRIPAVQ